MLRVEDVESNDGSIFKRNSAEHLQPLPVKNRQCRNIIWLILLFLFLGGMALIAYVAITTGNIYTLMYPADSNGQLCGFDSAQSEFPYLYYITPTDPQSAKVCVASCPIKDAIPATTNETICVGRISPNNTAFTQLISDGACASDIYASRSVLKRCVPNNFATLVGNDTTNYGLTIDLQNNYNVAVLVVGDFSHTWMWFLAFAGIAIAISLLWLLMMRVSATFTVWLLLIAGVSGANGLAIFTYFAWKKAEMERNESEISLSAQQVNQQTFFISFIVFTSLAGILDVLTIWFLKRIRIMIKLMKEVSRAINSMPALVLFPVWSFLLAGGFFAYWLVIQLLLASATSQSSQLCGNSLCSSYFLQYSQIYHLFGMIWIYQFISGINQMTIAGALETWYWAEDKRAIKKFPVLRSFRRTLRYHIGVSAAGSLWSVLLFIPRSIILFISPFIKKRPSCVTGCCCATFFAPIRLVNSTAYMETALYGQSYRRAAMNSFDLFTRNANRLIFIDTVTPFVMNLGKSFIAGASGVGSYYWFNYWYSANPLNYVAVSVLIIVLITFLISNLFMQIYEYGVQVLFLCVCHNIEEDADKGEKWPLMSKELQLLINAKNVPAITNKVNPETTSKTVTMRQAFVDDV